MENDGLVSDLSSLVILAEEVRDGERDSFPIEVIPRLCNELRRAIERLSGDDPIVS